MNDNEFLNWLADRLVNVYGESSNVDFVLKLRALAQQCVCGEPDSAGTHRTDGPCLAPQPEQEPVAWQRDIETGRRFMPHGVLPSVGKKTGWTPLYTTPPTQQSCSQRPSRSDMTWVGLTDEDLRELGFETRPRWWPALEAKLKEKNTRNGGCL